MKKSLLLSFFIISIDLSAYELKFDKLFNKNIQNDIVRSHISITVESFELDEITKKIDLFQKLINKENKLIISNGNFTQIPSYKYINKKQVFSGYKGTLSYNVESNKYKTLNEFFSKLTKEQKKIKSNQVKLSISNTSWQVSKELYDKTIDSMRVESIDWIKNYSKNNLGSCNIENISINKNNNFNPNYYKSNLSIQNTTRQVTPLQSEKSINLSVNYQLDCK